MGRLCIEGVDALLGHYYLAYRAKSILASASQPITYTHQDISYAGDMVPIAMAQETKYPERCFDQS